jgi:hypothetical protein
MGWLDPERECGVPAYPEVGQEPVESAGAESKNHQGKGLTGGNARIEQTGEWTIIRMPVREQNKVNTLVKLEMETPVPPQ